MMNEQRFSDPTPLPEGWRWITWEIGEAELQKSTVAVEAFEALRTGESNVKAIRARICQKRKLAVSQSTGEWTKTPRDRFVNEHAWVLEIMNVFGMISKVDSRAKRTSLLPGAEERLSAVGKFFKRNEPFEWKPEPYEKALGW